MTVFFLERGEVVKKGPAANLHFCSRPIFDLYNYFMFSFAVLQEATNMARRDLHLEESK